MEEILESQNSVGNNQTKDGNTSNGRNEPLLVGTNTTFKLNSSSTNTLPNSDSQPSAGDNPIAVGTNLTIEINDSDGQLLEQLGISQDGSNYYLGTNISISGDGSSWMNRIEGNPLYSGSFPSVSGGSTPFNDQGNPLLVGTNITFKIISSSDLNSPSGSARNVSSSDDRSNAATGPIAVGTNLSLELTANEGNLGELVKQFSIGPDGSNDYLGNNISTSGDGNSWGNTNNRDPLTSGGFSLGNANNASSNSGNYGWNFIERPNNLPTEGSSEGMGESTGLDELFKRSPWGSLAEVGITSFEQVFPNVPNDMSDNPFGDGSNNPFAGGAAIG